MALFLYTRSFWSLDLCEVCRAMEGCQDKMLKDSIAEKVIGVPGPTNLKFRHIGNRVVKVELAS